VKGMISKKKDNPEIALQQFLIAIHSFEKIKEVKKTYYNQSILYFYAGNCYFDLAQFDNARAAFQKSKDFAVSTESNSLEAYAIKGLSQIEKQRHQNSNALELLFEAEKKGQNTEDATLVEEIYKEMADNYLVLGSQNLYQDYTKKLQDLQYKREQLEISSVNESIDIHNAATISKLEQLKDEYLLKNIIIIILGLLISILLLWKGIRVMKKNTKDTKEIQKILKS
jgi:tetratricopeptide (TPR) repeat protein